MKRRELLQVMTSLLIVAFLTLMVTGLWQRFGDKSETLQQTHAICGMVFIILVFFHWAAFWRALVSLMRSKHHE